MKKFILVIGLTMVLLLSACQTDSNDNTVVDDTDKKSAELLELTIEQLEMYDGKDGNDAYIAVDDVIYDVTGVSAWRGGTHNGNMAGTDVSDIVNSAPHGDSVLDDLEIVGSIVE